LFKLIYLDTGLNDILRLIFTGVNSKLRKEKFWEWIVSKVEVLSNK